MEDKRAGKTGGAGPSQRYETRFGQKQNDAGATGAPDKAKKAGYRLSTEIERTTDLQKVLEERILDNKVDLSHRWRPRCWTTVQHMHGSRARMGVTRSSS